MNKIFAILLIATLFACHQKQAREATVQKINSDWLFKSKNDTEWHSATVPGNIFTDLLDHKLIEDPFIKTNEDNVQWVSDSTWLYKTTFGLDHATRDREHIELEFAGLDTYAKVYLNDELILTSNNAFRKFNVEVTSKVKKSNEISIEFASTSIFEEREKEKLAYEMPEGNRIFTRKAQFQYGWDWGPKINTAGIWKEISLKRWSAARILDISFSDDLGYSNQSSKAAITIESDLDGSAEIIGGDEHIRFDRNIQLKKGTHTYTIKTVLDNPKLWWPHNVGDPHMYSFKFQLILDGKVIDKRSLSHGYRTIELIAEKDAIGQTFYFSVNGIPIFAKGANYIPQNSFQNRVSPEHYENLLNDVVDANMNMLRVWGGGIYENDIFYQLCDEKGILVWQDFMFACAMYPGDDAFLKNVKQEAINQVKRLRNYASIALWAGNNESSEGWHRWGWQNGKTEEQKKEIWSNYLKVFDDILPNTVKELSPATSYWESSPKYGRGNPNYEKEGDAHDWWVWHDAYPFEHFEEHVPRFMSEFGFQSFPSFAAINYINQKDTVDIHTKAMKSHQKHARGFQLINEYMERDYPIPTSDEDYVYISQLLQAKGITMGIEAQRRARPYNMGSLYWQLNDCWPVISWSSIDYFGNWKALHYKAKKSFQDVLISSKVDSNEIAIHIVNDLLIEIKDTLRLKIIDFSGKELWSKVEPVRIEKNSSQKMRELSLSQLKINAKNSVLVTSTNSSGANFHYFDSPKELDLKNSEIKSEIRKHTGGFWIEVSSQVLQKDVFLSTVTKGHFSDNFFDLLPNGHLY